MRSTLLTFYALFFVLSEVTCTNIHNAVRNTFITHGHLDAPSKNIKNCPKNECIVYPDTILYFWRFENERFPLMFLSTDKATIPVTSMDVILHHDIKISKSLAREIDVISNDQNTAVVQVKFTNLLAPGQYTLLLNDKYQNYIMSPMKCRAVKSWYHFWHSYKLQCVIEKSQIRQLPKQFVYHSDNIVNEESDC